MSLLGNVAFRELVAGYGGYGLLYSEMCTAKAIPSENRHVSPYFRWRDDEKAHLVFQIVGAEPDEMAAAARRIEEENLFGVDINLGCPAAAVCRKNAGASLLKDPGRALAVVSAVRQAVSFPVTVKYRTGWEDDPEPAVELAKRFEDIGVDAVIFHPRVAPDRRTRPPRWEYIGRVKAAVSIPVFGNGDVFTAEDCLTILQSTGCDGVAIGRMAVARPWLFAQWTEGYDPGPEEYGDVSLRLLELLQTHYDPDRALGRFKKFAYYFSSNFQFGHSLYSRIQNAGDLTVVKDALLDFFQHHPKRVSRPNRNYFS